MNESFDLPQSSRVLRKMAVTFALMTAILTAVVLYMALSRAKIIVTLGSIDKEYSFRLTLAEDVFGRERPPRSVPAIFLETTEEAEDTFTPSGSGERTGKAGGVVTLHNETDRSQPLVATTRLISPEGILFRLQAAALVPARGIATAAVEADKEGSGGEIGPTRFTIPGLAQSLQSVIYATSEAPMVRGGAMAKTVTAQDLETARQALRQRLLDKTHQVFVAQVGEEKLTAKDFLTDIIEEEASAKADEVVNSFTLKTKLKIIGVVFDKEEMTKAALLEMGGNVGAPALADVQYAIGNYNAESRTASLSGRALSGTVMDKSSSIFAADNFTGLALDEVKSLLNKYEGIENVEIQMSPYWQRHLPRIPSRIKVEFK